MARSKIILNLGNLSVELLPEFGGRISSIKLRGHEEWIAQPQSELIARSPGSDFIRPEISGWDEMVPTTDACKSLNDGIDLPDHGEVWARSWNVDQITDNSALLSVKLNTRTLNLTRKITLIEISENAYEIKLQYSLQNYGDSQIPAFWSSHPLFRAEGVKEIVIENKLEMIRTAPTQGIISQTYHPDDLDFGTSAEFWCNPDDKIESMEILREGGDSLSLGWNSLEIPYFGIFVDNNEFSMAKVISPQPAIAYKVSERDAQGSGRIQLLSSGQSISWNLLVYLTSPYTQL
jgi:hypothetical protein